MLDVELVDGPLVADGDAKDDAKVDGLLDPSKQAPAWRHTYLAFCSVNNIHHLNHDANKDI